METVSVKLYTNLYAKIHQRNRKLASTEVGKFSIIFTPWNGFNQDKLLFRTWQQASYNTLV